jgi:mannose-6-phosphate isomerase-like protein (cupin superfamily)
MKGSMRATLSVLIFLLMVSVNEGVAGAQQSSPGAQPPPATDVTAEDIQATLKQEMSSGKAVTDTSIRVVDAGGHNVGIGAVYRLGPAKGSSASHDKVTEVYYMIEGAGTLVTGGTLVNPQRRKDAAEVVTQVNGPGTSGTKIEGGVSRRIKAGDMVIIPAGTPHWWSEIEGSSMKYVVVRIDPSQVVTLK